MRLEVGSCKMGAVVIAVALAACVDRHDDDGYVPGMDASTIEGGLDASLGEGGLDADLRDGSPRDATDGATERCISPLHPPAARGTGNGCACQASMQFMDGYCIDEIALVCSEGHWAGVVDGPCAAQLGQPPGWCGAQSGFVPSMAACPSGFHSKRNWGDAGAEERCCVPLVVSASECAEAGLMVLASAVDGGLPEMQCPAGHVRRGFVMGTPAASLCCE